MKVLFLDVDGVLNNDQCLMEHGADHVGDVFLDRLKSIIEQTGAKIVLSSSWRLYDDSKELIKKALKTRGLYISDTTVTVTLGKFSQYIPRADEIKEWLSRHDVEKFAIVDDDPDAGLNMKDSYFQTEFEIGLTDDIKNKIIECLK